MKTWQRIFRLALSALLGLGVVIGVLMILSNHPVAAGPDRYDIRESRLRFSSGITSSAILTVSDGFFAVAGQVIVVGDRQSVISMTNKFTATLSPIIPSIDLTSAGRRIQLFNITDGASVSQTIEDISATFPALVPGYNYIVATTWNTGGGLSTSEMPGLLVTPTIPLTSQWAITQIGGLPSTLTGQGVEIAIFDASCFEPIGAAPVVTSFGGISLTVTHPTPTLELTSTMSPTSPVNLCGHGMYVASLAHMVAPGASLHLVRVANDEGLTDLFDVAYAVNQFAMSNTNSLNNTVINLSLGVLAPITDDVPALLEVLSHTHSLGAVIVAAAGNDSTITNTKLMQVPARYPFVIGVAATDDAGQAASYSNAGDVAAPGGYGESITYPLRSLVGLDPTALPTSTQRYWAGTSFAAPFVSGLAALLREQNTGWTPAQIGQQITSTTTPGTADAVRGAGVINVCRAVLSCGRIDGIAQYQGRSDHSGHAGIQVTATGPVVQSATTNASGQYTLTLLPGGSYAVKADAPLYLPNCTTASVTDGQTTRLLNTTLPGGDIAPSGNENNIINIGDVTLLAANLNHNVPQADINADGIVNAQDLAITGGNWGKSGCPASGWLGIPFLAAADTPVLSLRPDQAELLPGQTLVAEAWLENAPEIYGFEVHITFDPALLEVVDADPAAPGIQILPGDFISPSQQSFTIRNQADNVTGTLEYAITLMNPAPPVSGTGRLFNIAFRAIVSGTAAVSITDRSLLGTRAGETIAPIRQNLQVTIRQWRFRVFMPNIMVP